MIRRMDPITLRAWIAAADLRLTLRAWIVAAHAGNVAAAAADLRLTRRAVAYYLAGQRPIPRYVERMVELIGPPRGTPGRPRTKPVKLAD